MFHDRDAAARELASKLRRYAGHDPLVLAVPRGGVPVGRVVALELDGDLDVVLVHKLGSPFSHEFAVGAVDEQGHVELHGDEPVDPAYVDQEAQRQLRRLHERRALYRDGRPPPDPRGRTVIVVDDGVATGATLGAALRALRAQHPARLIAGVPVAPPDTARRLYRDADEVVILESPARFFAVGQFYVEFPAVSDEQVVATLREHRLRRAQQARARTVGERGEEL